MSAPAGLGPASNGGSLPVGDSDQVRVSGLAIDELVARILLGSSRLAPDQVGAFVLDEARRAGFTEAAIFLVDCELRVLVPLPPRDGLSPREVDGTLAGRVFQLERPLLAGTDEPPVELWVPLLDGAERLGVMLLGLPTASEDVLEPCQRLASLVAELVVSKTQYGDALILPRRRRPMTLAAELRWSSLPPLNFTGSQVGIACVLEPAYEVAGDAFDYAANDDVLHLAIVDAMGHGLEASRMGTVAITTYRHARRRNQGLEEMYRGIDEVIRTEFGEDRFVTGQLATLDQHTGRLRWVNAGHPPPLLLRDGKVSMALTAEPWLPFGIGGAVPRGPALDVAEHSLQPGDRVLFFTDGVVEARSTDGEPFGVDRLVQLTRRAMADRHTLAETVRRLARSVLDHQQGVLQDDGTILLLEWHPVRELV